MSDRTDDEQVTDLVVTGFLRAISSTTLFDITALCKTFIGYYFIRHKEQFKWIIFDTQYDEILSKGSKYRHKSPEFGTGGLSFQIQLAMETQYTFGKPKNSAIYGTDIDGGSEIEIYDDDEEEEEEIEPRRRYSSSDIIAAAQELRFIQKQKQQEAENNIQSEDNMQNKDDQKEQDGKNKAFYASVKVASVYSPSSILEEIDDVRIRKTIKCAESGLKYSYITSPALNDDDSDYGRSNDPEKVIITKTLKKHKQLTIIVDIVIIR